MPNEIESVDDYVTRLVSEAPRPTPEQREIIRAALIGSAVPPARQRQRARRRASRELDKLLEVPDRYPDLDVTYPLIDTREPWPLGEKRKSAETAKDAS